MPGTLFLAFLAGLLSIFSPCVLPLAPIVVAGARARDPRAPLALALGLAVTFGLVGGIFASLGLELGGSRWIHLGAALLMIVVGLAMLVPVLGTGIGRVLAPLSRWADALGQRLPASGLLGHMLAGVVLAFAWTPCIGPTIGGAFALAAAGGSLAAAMATMTCFASGAALALLAAGYGLGRLAAGRVAALGRVALGGAFVAVGALMVTGLDHALETALVQAMPDWLVLALTKI